MIFRSKSLTFTEEIPRIKNPQEHGTLTTTDPGTEQVEPNELSSFFDGQPISPLAG